MIVVLHPRNRATLITLPPAPTGEPCPSDIELDTVAALEQAAVEAERFGLSTIYVSEVIDAHWNPAWGELRD